MLSILISCPDNDGDRRGLSEMASTLLCTSMFTDTEIDDFINYWRNSKDIYEGQDVINKFQMYCSKLQQDLHVTITKNRQTNRAQIQGSNFFTR